MNVPVTIDKGLPTSCALVPGQHLEGGGLPSPVDTQQAKALPWSYAHAQTVHSEYTPNFAGFVHLAHKEGMRYK